MICSRNRAKAHYLLLVGILAAFAGCGKSSKEIAASATPLPPKEAATQLQQAFTAASPETKNIATQASEAIRSADYSKAVQSLYEIKGQTNLTLNQGMAIHNSEVALEAALISRVGAGDPNAKQAYDLLKKSRRN
jgi:hypothetical protein